MSKQPPAALMELATALALGYDARIDLETGDVVIGVRIVQPVRAGTLTDTDWYPARVCSGRERLHE